MLKIRSFFYYEFCRKESLKLNMLILAFFSFMIFDTFKIAINLQKQGFEFKFWEFVLMVFINPRNISIIMILGFIIFINDLVLDYELTEQIFIRVNSRKIWWNTKVMVLITKTLIFIASLTLYTLIFAFFNFKYDINWSKSILGFKSNTSISNDIIDSVKMLNTISHYQSAAKSFSEILVLLLLGCFCIGLFIMIITLLFNSRISGLFSSFFIWILCIIPNYAVNINHSIISKIIYNHINYATHKFYFNNNSFSTLLSSLIYWVTLIIIFYYIGYCNSLKRNFIRSKK